MGLKYEEQGAISSSESVRTSCTRIVSYSAWALSSQLTRVFRRQ